MSEKPNTPAELLRLCGDVRDGIITPEGVARLDQILQSSREAQDFYVFFMSTASLLESRGSAHVQAGDEASISEEEDVDLLFELLQLEKEAPAKIVEVENETPLPLAPEARDAIRLNQVRDVAGYLCEQAFRSGPVRWMGAAAALLIATIVVWQVAGPAPQSERLGPAATVAPQQTAFVARVTGQLGVRWHVESGHATPTTGQGLEPGRWLMLEEGYAEITTASRARVILEAPCVIELVDNNALRLLSGKLVGIAEVESARGLTIHTAHADVVDLGTRFGVDASRADSTEVHIFEGEVKVALPGTREAPVERLLSAGDAVAVNRQNSSIDNVARDGQRFAGMQAFERNGGAAAIQIVGVRAIAGELEQTSAARFTGEDAAQWPTADRAFLFHDFVGRLQTDVRVNIAEPGDYDKLPNTAASTVPAGTNVRSYVIYKSGNPSGTTTATWGSVTFENEVLAIITDESANTSFVSAIRATSPAFTPGKGVDRWIDLYTFQERVTLSEDRRTVSFNFQVKESTDTIRVLVRAD